MTSHFTPSDSAKEVALRPDPRSHREFWATVIHLATVESASEIRYRLDAGDDCLSIKVDGCVHAMNPPPVEYRRDLLTSLRRLARDGLLGELFTRLFPKSRSQRPFGIISFERWSEIARWHAYNDGAGVTLKRVGAAADAHR